MGQKTARRGVVDAFMRGWSSRLYSSEGLGWSGALLEGHLLTPGEWPAGNIEGMLLCLWDNATALRCDHPDARGEFVPKLVQPGTFSIYTAGSVAAVRLHAPAVGIACVFDDHLIHNLDEETSAGNLRSIADGLVAHDKRCFTDGTLYRLVTALAEEARLGAHHGRMYVEEQVAAIADRLSELIRTNGSKRWLRYCLDTRLLRRILDRVEAACGSDLDLESLAVESGYSKRHLLRVFRASTGKTPHQFILDLRLERARRLMLQQQLSMLDIALECGFANHAHFSRSFRQRLGVTPQFYRASL